MNFAFLLCIVFVPFAASFLGQGAPVQAAVVAYGVVLTLTSLVLAMLVAYAFRAQGVIAQSLIPIGVPRKAMQRILWPVAIYLLSMLTSIISIGLSVAIYVALPIAFLLPSKVDHWAQ